MKYSDVTKSHDRLIKRSTTAEQYQLVNFGAMEGEGYITSKLYPGYATTYYNPDTHYIEGHSVED